MSGDGSPSEGVAQTDDASERLAVAFRYPPRGMDDHLDWPARYRAVLREFTAAMASLTSPQQLLMALCERMGHALGVERAIIYDIDMEREMAVGQAQWQSPALTGVAPSVARWPASAFRTAAEWMWTERKPLLSQSDDPAEQLRHDGAAMTLHTRMGIKSLLWFPFAFRARGWNLLAFNQLSCARAWTRAEVELVADAAQLVELALDKLRVIAARDEALAAAQRTAGDLAALIATTTTGVLFETDARTIHVVNGRFCDLAGVTLPPDRLVGDDCRSVVRRLADITVDPVGFLRRTEEIISEAASVSGDVISLVDGRVFERDYVRVGARSNERGHLWLYRDVTAQRHDQELRRHLERAIEQSPVGVVVTDARGDIVWVNERFSRISGYSRDEAIGRNPLFERSDDTSAETFEALRATITAGLEWTGEISNRHKDGEPLPLKLTVSPVLDEWHRITHYVAVQEDLREQRRAAAALQAADERLRLAQKMEAVSRFAGGVAHDFNNLLSVILGYAGIVHAQMSADDPLREDVAQIEAATERAAALSRRLLAFSRRDALDPRPVDINASVNELNRVLRRLIGEDIDLVVELDDAAGAVTVDPSQLEQAVLNLAGNARDAMPHGGTLTVSSAVAEIAEGSAPLDAPAHLAPGVYTVLSVADTGTGIDDATRARVFDPFFTTKEVGKGTGLGLTIVQDFARQSHGGVALSSQVGVGSVFSLWLPRRDVSLRSKSPGAPRSHPPDGSQEMVLVVEDEPELRSLARRVLTGAGYRVTIAANGGEALLWCEKRGDEAKLILCDVVMPGMRGPELIRRIMPLCPNAKVMFMSGYVDGVSDVLPPGAQLLAKPFEAKALLARVKALLHDE